MATNTRSTHRKKDNSISTADWNAEALVAHRSVWEIAAMAGNVMPQLAAVKAKKEADPEWKKGYERIIRLMTNALSPTRGPVADHVYYEPNRSGNAALTRSLSKLRQVRVDVTSAIEFLWNVYGENYPPEGFQVVHQLLHSQNADVPRQTVVGGTKEAKESHVQPLSTPNTAHRDQRLANATKDIKRLSALVYILTNELFNFSKESRSVPPDLLNDVHDSIKDAGLLVVEGFGKDSIEKLLNRSFDHYFELKP